jgi:flagellar biosynthesis protein FlhB
LYFSSFWCEILVLVAYYILVTIYISFAISIEYSISYRYLVIVEILLFDIVDTRKSYSRALKMSLFEMKLVVAFLELLIEASIYIRYLV